MGDMFDAMMMDLLMRNPEMLNVMRRQGRRRGPKTVKCPVCNEEHNYTPAPDRGRMENRFSHDARVSFHSAQCPVCLDENAGPPMVNQACGHMVCPDCFEQLGGKIGEDAMLSPEAAAQRDEAEAEDDDEDAEVGIRAIMEAMRNQGIPPVMMMPGMMPPGFFRQEDDEYDDDDDDDYDEEEEDTESEYEDMPPLLGEDGRAIAGSEEESSDEDMPPLIPSRARNVAAADGNENTPGPNPPNAEPEPPRAVEPEPPQEPQQNDQDEVNESDDESDMPALIPRQLSDIDSDDTSDEDSGIPALIPRNYRDQSDSDTEEEKSENEISDSESSLPPLLPRGQRDNDSESEDDESESDVSLPPLIARDQINQDSEDEESDEYSIPKLFTPVDSRAAEVSASDSDHDSMPGLISRDDDDYDDDSDIEDEDDMPPAGRPSKSREDLIEEEKEKAGKMRPSQLKRELRNMGIATDSFVEKRELVEAYANAVVDKKMPAAQPETRRSAPTPPPPPADPYADMPGLMPAKDPPKNGAWILTPKSDDDNLMELVYAYVDESQVKSRVYGEFAKGATLLTGLNGSTWVYARNPSSDKWEIHLVKEIDLRVKMYEFDDAEKLTIDGHNGVWALCPDRDSRNGYDMLVLVNSRNPGGMRIRGSIPKDSRLIMDRSGGTWLFVPSETSSAASLQPGLWHFTVSSSNRILTDVDDDAKIIYDSDRQGLWILSPAGPDKSNLMHIDEGGDGEEEEIDVDISNVRAIIDDGSDGVFVHCRIGERWKLCRAAQGRNNMEVVVDCPKTSWITSDGEGGAWIWKKSGKTANRMLTHVDSDSNSCEREERFPAGSLMGGIP